MAQFSYGPEGPEMVTVIGHGGREIQIEKQVAEAMGYEPVKPSKPGTAAKPAEKKEA